MLKRTKPVFEQAKSVSHYVPPSQRAIIEHKEFAKRKRQSDILGKIVRYGALTLVGGSLLMYVWQPWNPYSKEVSKELRKGLWEERDSKEDYLQALQHYITAMQVAKDEEGMNQLSLQYTGIVLKVAEMYQNLKMTDKLITTYYNLSTFIFENLIHGNISDENTEKNLLIDRDLIVITRWAMLMQKTKPKNWLLTVNNELRDRMAFIENKEIVDDLPWVASSPQSRKVRTEDLIDIWAESKADSLGLSHEKKTKWIEENIESEEGKEYLECWQILRSYKDKNWPAWIESYLRMRDFYAMLQLSTGNVASSIQILQSNLLWSVIAGFENAVSGTTQIHNLASAWFQLGQLTSDKTAYTNSKKIYERLIAVVPETDPILPISYYSLGVLALQLDDEKLASQNFAKARTLAVDLDQIQIVDKIDDELMKKMKLA